jgi:hypothetical protein
MASEEKLNELLWFRPHPGPIPDPASLLKFIVELEKPAVARQAIGALLQMSAESLQAQLKFVQSLQKAVSSQG